MHKLTQECNQITPVPLLKKDSNFFSSKLHCTLNPFMKNWGVEFPLGFVMGGGGVLFGKVFGQMSICFNLCWLFVFVEGSLNRSRFCLLCPPTFKKNIFWTAAKCGCEWAIYLLLLFFFLKGSQFLQSLFERLLCSTSYVNSFIPLPPQKKIDLHRPWSPKEKGKHPEATNNLDPATSDPTRIPPIRTINGDLARGHSIRSNRHAPRARAIPAPVRTGENWLS